MKKVWLIAAMIIMLAMPFVSAVSSLQLHEVETTGTGSYASIALDSAGYIHIAHIDFTNRDLRYCNNTQGSWSCMIINDTTPTSSYITRTHIAIDSNDKVHIIYPSAQYNINYCSNSAGAWACDWVETSTTAGSSHSLAIGSDNVAHVSVCSSSTNYYLKYYNNSGGVWTDDISVDTSETYLCDASSIAVDSNGTKHIAYHDNVNNALKYAYNSSAVGWTKSFIDVNKSGDSPSISIDLNGKVHIASILNESSGIVRLCDNINGSWVCTNVTDDINYGTSATSSMTLSLALDNNNKNHIIFGNTSNQNGNNYTIYCKDVSGTWNCSDLFASDGVMPQFRTERTFAMKKGLLATSASFSSTGNFVFTNRTDSDNLYYGNFTLNFVPEISNITEPLDPSTYSYTATYNFTAIICDTDGVADISSIIFQWSTTNYTLTTYDTGTNTTCRLYYKTIGGFAAQTATAYNWYASDFASAWSNTASGTFTISKATGYIYDFAFNDTYIHINQSVNFYCNASAGDQLNLTVITSGKASNLTASWNGTAYRYDLDKTQLGTAAANATTIFVSGVWFGSQNYTTIYNASAAGFDYGNATVSGVSNSPAETYNSPSDGVTVYAFYNTTEDDFISNNCSVTFGTQTNYTSYSTVTGRQQVFISTSALTPSTYNYVVTCSNQSYATGTGTGSFIVKTGTASAPPGGGGGGGTTFIESIINNTVIVVCGDGYCDTMNGENVTWCSTDCKANIGESGTIRAEMLFLSLSLAGLAFMYVRSSKKKKSRSYKTI